MKALTCFLLLIVVAVLALAKSATTVAPEITSAKTVAIIAKLGPIGNGGYTPDLQRATQQITEGLQKWGKYAIIADPLKADIVLVITEGHYGSITLVNGSVNGNVATGTGQNVAVLGDILQVYKGGLVPDEKSLPLWTRVETGGYSWPAKRAIGRFKKEVESSEKAK